MIKEKTCCKCENTKPLTEFYKHRHAFGGRQAHCKDCHKKINKKYHRTYKRNFTPKEKEEYRKRRRERQKERYTKEVDFKIRMLYSNRIYCALKQNVKSKKTMELLGCSIKELKKHLEDQFQEGMTWDNYGEWHIDHIRPCASFDLTDVNQQKECFHYTNLQPLWAKDNFSKSAKYEIC